MAQILLFNYSERSEVSNRALIELVWLPVLPKVDEEESFMAFSLEYSGILFKFPSHQQRTKHREATVSSVRLGYKINCCVGFKSSPPILPVPFTLLIPMNIGGVSTYNCHKLPDFVLVLSKFAFASK